MKVSYRRVRWTCFAVAVLVTLNTFGMLQMATQEGHDHMWWLGLLLAIPLNTMFIGIACLDFCEPKE